MRSGERIREGRMANDEGLREALLVFAEELPYRRRRVR